MLNMRRTTESEGDSRLSGALHGRTTRGPVSRFSVDARKFPSAVVKPMFLPAGSPPVGRERGRSRAFSLRPETSPGLDQSALKDDDNTKEHAHTCTKLRPSTASEPGYVSSRLPSGDRYKHRRERYRYIHDARRMRNVTIDVAHVVMRAFFNFFFFVSPVPPFIE